MKDILSFHYPKTIHFYQRNLKQREDKEYLSKLSSPIQMEEGETSLKQEFSMFYDNDDKQEMDYYVIEKDDQNVCSFDQFIEDTKDPDPLKKRCKALRRICICKIQKNVDKFWNRIFEMHTDPSPEVRYNVLHNILDGSSEYLELKVIETVQNLQYDEDKRIRRVCNKVLTIYRKTGKWNIL